MFGGRVSSEPPADWLPPLVRPPGALSQAEALPPSELSASVSNELKLSYETHPFDSEFSPFANKLAQRHGFLEDKFSTWVTNQHVETRTEVNPELGGARL